MIKIKRNFKRLINDELWQHRTAIGLLAFLTVISAVVLYDNPTVFSILLFGFCVFLALQNFLSARLYRAAQGMLVSDAMIAESSLISLNHSVTTMRAAELICKSFQPIFPVFHNKNLIGIIHKDRFLSEISSGFRDGYLADYIEKKFEYAYCDVELTKLLANGRLKAARNMVVFDKENNFLGILSYERLVEFLLLGRIIKESKNSELHDEFLL